MQLFLQKDIADYKLFTFPSEFRLKKIKDFSKVKEEIANIAEPFYTNFVGISLDSQVPFWCYAILIEVLRGRCQEIACELPLVFREAPVFLVLSSSVKDDVVRYQNIVYCPELFPSVYPEKIAAEVHVDLSTLRVSCASLEEVRGNIGEFTSSLVPAKSVQMSGRGDLIAAILTYSTYRIWAEHVVYTENLHSVDLL